MALGLLLCIGLLVLLMSQRTTAPIQIIAHSGARGGWRLSLLFICMLIALLALANAS